jgi:hypothetical protein
MPAWYSGGNVICDIYWVARTAITGNVVWAVAFEQILPGTTNVGSDSFAADVLVTSSAPGVNGVVQLVSIVFNSAQINGILANNNFRLHLQRNATDGGDTMVGDAELIFLSLRQ